MSLNQEWAMLSHILLARRVHVCQQKIILFAAQPRCRSENACNWTDVNYSKY